VDFIYNNTEMICNFLCCVSQLWTCNLWYVGCHSFSFTFYTVWPK